MQGVGKVRTTKRSGWNVGGVPQVWVQQVESRKLFKQKVKLNEGFPYGKCISFAFEETLDPTESNGLAPFLPMSSEDYAKMDKHKLKYSENTQIQTAKLPRKVKPHKVEMTEYAPLAFEQLRKRFGISNKNYLQSLSELSGDGMVGDGKSGMLFFFTRDRRYVLKTVKPNEMDVFIKTHPTGTDKTMLEAYGCHMHTNPDSLLCRYLGLYRFRLGPRGKSSEIFLVCMQNSFDTQVVLHVC